MTACKCLHPRRGRFVINPNRNFNANNDGIWVNKGYIRLIMSLITCENPHLFKC